MSEILTVRTNFEDIPSLAEGLVDRVDGQRLMLYGPEPYEAGDVISFSVLLLDGTPAMIGSGRVATYIDGGEERPPEARFDVVLDSLELEGRSEVVYERVVLARESFHEQGEPSPGEVDGDPMSEEADDHRDRAAAVNSEAYGWPNDELEGDPYADGSTGRPAFANDDSYEDASLDAEDVETSSGQAAAPRGYGSGYDYAGDDGLTPHTEEATAIADSHSFGPTGTHDDMGAGQHRYENDFGESYPAPEVRAEARRGEGPVDASTGEVALEDIEDVESVSAARPVIAAPAYREGAGPLFRPSRQASWAPEATAPRGPRPSSGLFDYGPDQLPVPSGPPRPDLDPSMRVSPAPRPAAETPANSSGSMRPGSSPSTRPSASSSGWPVEDHELDPNDSGEFEDAGSLRGGSAWDAGDDTRAEANGPDDLIQSDTAAGMVMPDAGDDDEASFSDVDAEIPRD